MTKMFNPERLKSARIYRGLSLSELSSKTDIPKQILGYLEQGKERGIFDIENKLTLFGMELYSDAKKCIEKKKRAFENESKEIFKVKEINYKPKIFNGRS
jgi:transcriptional regulator with XRE-family HTH domain